MAPGGGRELERSLTPQPRLAAVLEESPEWLAILGFYFWRSYAGFAF